MALYSQQGENTWATVAVMAYSIYDSRLAKQLSSLKTHNAYSETLGPTLDQLCATHRDRFIQPLVCEGELDSDVAITHT